MGVDPPSSRPAQVTLGVRAFSLAPRTPRAGRPATLTLRLATNDADRVAQGRFSCVVRAGATRLRTVLRVVPRAKGEPVALRCAWHVPRAARGRMLRAALRAVTAGRVAARRIDRRIS